MGFYVVILLPYCNSVIQHHDANDSEHMHVYNDILHETRYSWNNQYLTTTNLERCNTFYFEGVTKNEPQVTLDGLLNDPQSCLRWAFTFCENSILVCSIAIVVNISNNIIKLILDQFSTYCACSFSFYGFTRKNL